MLKALSWLARIGQIESLASLLSKPTARITWHHTRLVSLGGPRKHAVWRHSAHQNQGEQPYSACSARIMLGNENYKTGTAPCSASQDEEHNPLG